MGHSISYDEVNAVETSFAEDHIHNQLLHSYVPNNVQPSVFVTFVYDNCDHNPETLSGVSMHCTNGIIIQKVIIGGMPHTANTISIGSSSKRRSFTAVTSKLMPYHRPVHRLVPSTHSDIERDLNALDELLSKKVDLIWVCLRYQCSKELDGQRIPSWTGFHHEVSEEDTVLTHHVHYLPAIDQSPTKLDTVQEILVQVKSKAEAIGFTCTDLVLDHAIYAKALEVMYSPSNADLMGGFHACSIFLG